MEMNPHLHTNTTQPNAGDIHTTSIRHHGANTTSEQLGIIPDALSLHPVSSQNDTAQTQSKGHGETDLARTNLDTFLISLDLRRFFTSL